MTDKLRAAAQAALEALERYQVKRQDFERFADEITALRAALAEHDSDWSLLEATKESLREHMAEIHWLCAALAEPVQPVAFPDGYEPHELPADYTGKLWIEGQVRALHDRAALAEPTSPRRDWVGLTEPELHCINPTWPNPNETWEYEQLLSFVRAIEAALKEKNT